MFFSSTDRKEEHEASAAVIRFSSQSDNTHTQELMTSVINTFFFFQKVYEEFLKTAVLLEQLANIVNDLLTYEIIKESEREIFSLQLQWIVESRNDKFDIIDERHILISNVFLCLIPALKDQDKYIDGSTYIDRLRKLHLIIQNIKTENACTVGIRNELMCILHNSYRGIFITTEITSTVTTLIREFDEQKLNQLLCSEDQLTQERAFKILLCLYGTDADEQAQKFYDNYDELREAIYQKLSNSLGYSLRTQKEFLEKKIPNLYTEIDKAFAAREHIQLMPSGFEKVISELKKYFDCQGTPPLEIQQSFSQCKTLEEFSKSKCYGYLTVENLYQKAKSYATIIAIGTEEASIKDKSREILLYLEAIGYPKSFNLMNISLEDFSAKINVLEDDFSQLLAKQDYQNIIIDSFALLRASEANLRDFKKIYYRVVRVFNEYHLDFTDDGLTNLVNVSVEIENDHTYINITPYTLNRILWQALLTSPDTWNDVFKQAIQLVLQLLQQENTDSTEHFLLIKESSYSKELIEEVVWLLSLSNDPEANQNFLEFYLPCGLSNSYLETDDNLLKIYGGFPFLTDAQKEMVLKKLNNADKIIYLIDFIRHITEISELEFVINHLPELAENERNETYHALVEALSKSMVYLVNTHDTFHKIIKQIKMPYRLSLFKSLNYTKSSIQCAIDIYHSIINFNEENHEQALNDPDIIYILKLFLFEKHFNYIENLFNHEKTSLKLLIKTINDLINECIRTNKKRYLCAYVGFFIDVSQVMAKSNRTYTIDKLTITYDWQKRFLEKFCDVVHLDFKDEKNKKYYEELKVFYGEISDLPERENINKVQLIEIYVGNENHLSKINHAKIVLSKLSDAEHMYIDENYRFIRHKHLADHKSTNDQPCENNVYVQAKRVLKEWFNGKHSDLIEILINYVRVSEAPPDKVKTFTLEHLIEVAYLSRVHETLHQDNYDNDARVCSYITNPLIRRCLLEYLDLYQLTSRATSEDKRKKFISALITIENDYGFHKLDDECKSAIQSLIIKNIDIKSMEDIKNFMMQFDDRSKYVLITILIKIYCQHDPKIDAALFRHAGFVRLYEIYKQIDKTIEQNSHYKMLLKAGISRACLCETDEQAIELIKVYERLYNVAMQFQDSKIINRILLYGIRPGEDETIKSVNKGLDAIINVNNTLEKSELLALMIFDFCNRQGRDPLGMNWIAEDKMYAVLTFESNDDESKDEARQIADLSRTLLVTYDFCGHNFNESFETMTNMLWNNKRCRPDWYDKIKYLAIGLLQAFVMELMNPDELLDDSDWYHELFNLIRWTDNHPKENFLNIIKSPYFYFFADLVTKQKHLSDEQRFDAYETLIGIMKIISEKPYTQTLQSLYFIDFAKFVKETLHNSDDIIVTLEVILDIVKHNTFETRAELKDEIVSRIENTLPKRIMM